MDREKALDNLEKVKKGVAEDEQKRNRLLGQRDVKGEELTERGFKDIPKAKAGVKKLVKKMEELEELLDEKLAEFEKDFPQIAEGTDD